MVSREEFKKYLTELFKDDSSGMNLQYMSKSYSKVSVCLVIFGFIAFIISFGLVGADIPFGMILLIASIIGVIIGFVRLYNSNKVKKYYKEKYRDKVMSFLFKGIDYTFDSQGQIESNIFDQSQFEGYYERYCGLDKLSINIPNDDGSVSDNYLTLCDLKATKTETDSDGDSRTVTVYEGVFGYIKFPFEFKCVLCLNTKYKKKGVSLEKVSLEDINFGKKIGVYCSDQIEARYILTPNMMEKLIWIASKMSFMRMTLVDNKMYIGFEGKDLFELSDVKDNKIETAFEKFYDEISVLLKLVDEIKTNNKIFKI